MHIQFKSMYPEFKEIVDQCIYLGKQYADWPNNEDGQLAIQTDDPNIDNWTSGIGKSVAKTPEWEQQFKYIQPSREQKIKQPMSIYACGVESAMSYEVEKIEC